MSIALEQCKTEGVVDVFQVTKAVRRSKPGAVTTLVYTRYSNYSLDIFSLSLQDQYTSIYDVIEVYLAVNNTYANFQ